MQLSQCHREAVTSYESTEALCAFYINTYICRKSIILHSLVVVCSCGTMPKKVLEFWCWSRVILELKLRLEPRAKTNNLRASHYILTALFGLKLLMLRCSAKGWCIKQTHFLPSVSLNSEHHVKVFGCNPWSKCAQSGGVVFTVSSLGRSLCKPYTICHLTLADLSCTTADCCRWKNTL